MKPILLLAALILQAMVTAQDRPIAGNPLEDDALWRFHIGASAYASARDTIARASSAADIVAAHLTIGDHLGAVRAAPQLLSSPPAELARGLNALVERGRDLTPAATALRDQFASFVTDARTHIDSLSTEDGAEAAAAMIWLENRIDPSSAQHQRRIDAFLTRYAGTAAAAELEVGQVVGNRIERDPEAPLRRLRDAATKYDRTCAGAKALYLLGSRVGHPAVTGNDTAQRLLRVFEIVKELESGRFPPCRWVEQASELIFDFYYGTQPYYAAADHSRVYQGYLEFVLAHRERRGRNASDGFRWLLQQGVGRLGENAAARRATLERFYADLALNGYGAEEAQLFRARFQPGILGPDDPSMKDPAEPLREARRILGRLIETGKPDTVARALATAAELDLSRRQYADARVSYAQLASQFAANEWAWIAGFRHAQASEALGDPQALSMYESLASGTQLPASGVVLARIAAGDIRESANAYADAVAHYRAAVTAWKDLPDPISIRTGNLDDKPSFARFNDLSLADLSKRIDRLSRLTSTSETLLYEGRRAYESQRHGDAILPLKTLLGSYPKSNAAGEGRILLRRAQLAEILSRRQQDLPGIDRELELLSAAPYDSVTTPAKLARAAFTLRSSGRAEAEAMTTQALEEWHARQSLAPDTDTPLARDIAAIRAEVFRPRVSAAATMLQPIAPFAIVPKEIRVKIGDGKEERLSVPFAATPDTRVLFATSEQLDLMRMILARVRTDGPPSPEVRTWTRPDTVASHWSKMFSMQTNSLGRWTLTAYPAVGRIIFDRDNHALVDFSSSGYQGGTIEFEKENGIWIAKRIVSTWIV